MINLEQTSPSQRASREAEDSGEGTPLQVRSTRICEWGKEDVKCLRRCLISWRMKAVLCRFKRFAQLHIGPKLEYQSSKSVIFQFILCLKSKLLLTLLAY